MHNIKLAAPLKTGIFFLVLLCTQYVLHNNIFDRDLIGPHTWRQTQTQQNIDCFFEEDNNISHPRTLARGTGTGINPQEFPLLQWLIAQSYSVLGQSIRSTRIMCFLFGILAIFGFFLLLKNISQRNVTWYIGTTFFSFSPVLFYYMMNPLPDLLALVFAVWSMYYYVRADKEQSFWLVFMGTGFLTLATMAKLPYIVFAGVPIGYFIQYIKHKDTIRRNRMLLTSFLMIPAFSWYAYTLPNMQNNAALGGIFSSIESGDPMLVAILGNLTYSLPVLFLGYAAIVPFIAGLYILFRKRITNKKQYFPFVVTGILLLLYFLYECNLISTVHDYYMLPFIPVLFLIAASGVHFLYEFKVVKFAVIALALASPFVANSIIQPRWNPGVTEYCHDLFQFRDELRNVVPDSAMVVMGNDHTMNIMPYYIDKKGWTYVDSELQKFNLECYIRDGATYLYTNSEVTLQDTSLRPLFKREVAVYGVIHIFELMPLQPQ